jgi:zinc protease
MENKMKKILLIIFILLSIYPFLSRAQDKINFIEYNLDNGMHVILHQDKSTPIIAVTMMYHVGSKNENPTEQDSHIFSNT